jgi:hypothetical protein
MNVIETRLWSQAWDKLGRYLLAARVVTGMKAA